MLEPLGPEDKVGNRTKPPFQSTSVTKNCMPVAYKGDKLHGLNNCKSLGLSNINRRYHGTVDQGSLLLL